MTYRKSNLICLTGAAGAGKDTVADSIISEFPKLMDKQPKEWRKIAFADALKDICMRYLDLSHEDVYTQEGKERYNEFWGMTNRKILQKIGTEAFRNGFHRDVWVKITEIRAKKMLEEGYGVIISDCRFDNEAEMALRLGGIVIDIVRENNSVCLDGNEKTHPSETGIADEFVSFVFHNDCEIEQIAGKIYDLIK